MQNSNLKNSLYIGFTVFLIILMSILTWLYLSNYKEIKGDVPKVHKIAKSNQKSSIDKKKDVSESTEASSNKTSDVKTETSISTTENQSILTDSSAPYVSEFRFLYTAAGGDTLQTVSELTGVEVSKIAQVNGIAENVILVKDQKVYVP